MMLHEKYKTLFKKYGLTTPLRIAHFLAQLEHESGLKPISEDLRYSPKRLNEVFKKYFPTIELANKYAFKPVAIANRVYANRMGNSNEASGEGFKYRGRGFIQITGKDNYAALKKDTGIDYVNNPDLLLNEADAMISALWYWKRIGGNALADKDDLDAISDRINLGRDTVKEGDANGYKDRKQKLIKWKQILKA